MNLMTEHVRVPFLTSTEGSASSWRPPGVPRGPPARAEESRSAELALPRRALALSHLLGGRPFWGRGAAGGGGSGALIAHVATGLNALLYSLSPICWNHLPNKPLALLPGKTKPRNEFSETCLPGKLSE